jgi:predicted phage terminase large subunit-like protein
MPVSDYEALQALCRLHFGSFTRKAFSIIEPGTAFEWSWHLDCVAEHLQAVHSGEIKRLIINQPPRTLKSVQVAQIFPAWEMGANPSHQFINASYAHSLAERNVVKCRQIMQSDWYLETYPHTRISKDQNTKDYFTTTAAGAYKGTGIGGTVTGFGCKTLLIDDPLNPKEAASDTIRTTTINEVRSTLFSRFNDRRDIRLILIMQRLHEMDTTGDLLKDGGYHLLKLPAENKSEKTIHIVLGNRQWEMEPGQLLTPRLRHEDLNELRLDLTEYHYLGQYMQEPVPLGGGEFKEHWFQWYQPGGIKPREMNLVILVDAAGGDELNRKKKKTSDWTVMTVVGLGPDNNYYLLDMIRDRLNPTERIDTLFMLHRKWNAMTGKPPKVGYEKYGMMTDTHYIREKQRVDAYNFAIVELGGSVMKEERIRRLIPDMQNGRWFLPPTLAYVDQEGRKFDLITEFKGECASFPRARFDDILDSLSRVYESDLFLSFPKLKQTMTQRAIRAASAGASDDWSDW